MKPPSVKSELTLPRTGSVEESRVPERPRAVDIAVLERVLEIRKEQARLEDLRERAEGLKDKVQEVVYRKVLNDYSDRCASLEREATQLTVQLRDVYQKLQAWSDGTSLAHEQASLEVEELEFRHAVGELEQAQLAERLRAPEQVLAQCGTDLVAIDQMRARFLEISSPGVGADVPASQEPAGPSRSEEPSSAEATIGPSDRMAPIGFERLPNFALIERSLERTRVLPGPTEDSEAPTFAVPVAVLIFVGSPDTPSVEYRLGTLSYIGRSEDNLIQLTEPGASRRHAVVAATPTGFVVKDLQSQNGTFVNGEQVKERRLSDGDRIEIGDAQLIFRSPWGGRAPQTKSGTRTGV